MLMTVNSKHTVIQYLIALIQKGEGGKSTVCQSYSNSAIKGGGGWGRGTSHEGLQWCNHREKLKTILWLKLSPLGFHTRRWVFHQFIFILLFFFTGFQPFVRCRLYSFTLPKYFFSTVTTAHWITPKTATARVIVIEQIWVSVHCKIVLHFWWWS